MAKKYYLITRIPIVYALLSAGIHSSDDDDDVFVVAWVI